MIRRVVIYQLIAFFVISTLGVAYIGVSLVGLHIFHKPYIVNADFAASGGIFSNAEVTYRGHPVGRVGGMHLLANGVQVSLHIKNGVKIPEDLDAVVANQAPIGEQYVDLRPRTASGPYLHNGSRIPMSRTSAPIPVEDVILDVNKFAASVNTTELATNIVELGNAFLNTGPALQRLITGGDQLNRALTQALPATRQLLSSGRTNLITVQVTANEIRTFAQQLDLLGRQLAQSDSSFRQFISNGVSSAQELDGLLRPNSSAISTLLANLVTLNRIQVVRIPALKATMLAFPQGFDPIAQARHGNQVYQGFTGDPNNGCVYPGTDGRSPQSTSRLALDTRGYCNSPPMSNQQQRGQQNAPRPPGDTTANPAPGGGEEPGQSTAGDPTGPYIASAAASPANSTSFNLFSGAGAGGAVPSGMAVYDPYTGLVEAPDGSVQLLGSSGGQADIFGAQSWTMLILAGLSH